MQLLIELTLFVAGFTGLSYMLSSMGMAFPRFWQGILFWAFILVYLKYRIYPPDSIQRTGHVWNRFTHCRIHVDVGERGRLEKVQATDRECPRCPDRYQKATPICIWFFCRS